MRICIERVVITALHHLHHRGLPLRLGWLLLSLSRSLSSQVPSIATCNVIPPAVPVWRPRAPVYAPQFARHPRTRMRIKHVVLVVPHHLHHCRLPPHLGWLSRSLSTHVPSIAKSFPLPFLSIDAPFPLLLLSPLLLSLTDDGSVASHQTVPHPMASLTLGNSISK